jgi:hypothetical protein
LIIINICFGNFADVIAFGVASGDAITVGNTAEIVPGAICEDP